MCGPGTLSPRTPSPSPMAGGARCGSLSPPRTRPPRARSSTSVAALRGSRGLSTSRLPGSCGARQNGHGSWTASPSTCSPATARHLSRRACGVPPSRPPIGSSTTAWRRSPPPGSTSETCPATACGSATTATKPKHGPPTSHSPTRAWCRRRHSHGSTAGPGHGCGCGGASSPRPGGWSARSAPSSSRTRPSRTTASSRSRCPDSTRSPLLDVAGTAARSSRSVA